MIRTRNEQGVQYIADRNYRPMGFDIPFGSAPTFASIREIIDSEFLPFRAAGHMELNSGFDMVNSAVRREGIARLGQSPYRPG